MEKLNFLVFMQLVGELNHPPSYKNYSTMTKHFSNAWICLKMEQSLFTAFDISHQHSVWSLAGLSPSKQLYRVFQWLDWMTFKGFFQLGATDAPFCTFHNRWLKIHCWILCTKHHALDSVMLTDYINSYG